MSVGKVHPHRPKFQLPKKLDVDAGSLGVGDRRTKPSLSVDLVGNKGRGRTVGSVSVGNDGRIIVAQGQGAFRRATAEELKELRARLIRELRHPGDNFTSVATGHGASRKAHQIKEPSDYADRSATRAILRHLDAQLSGKPRPVTNGEVNRVFRDMDDDDLAVGDAMAELSRPPTPKLRPPSNLDVDVDGSGGRSFDVVLSGQGGRVPGRTTVRVDEQGGLFVRSTNGVGDPATRERRLSPPELRTLRASLVRELHDRRPNYETYEVSEGASATVKEPGRAKDDARAMQALIRHIDGVLKHHPLRPTYREIDSFADARDEKVPRWLQQAWQAIKR